MTTTLLDVPRPSGQLDTLDVSVAALDAPPAKDTEVARVAKRGPAVALMAAGVALALAAAGLVTLWPSRAVPEAVPAGILVAGTENVAVQLSGYEPHESSSWHRHSGLHAVAVISGTLTVYGPDCRPVRYGPGESFVGGQGLHMARNETDEPVQMTETLLFPAGVPLQEFVVPAGPPAGCDVR